MGKVISLQAHKKEAIITPQNMAALYDDIETQKRGRILSTLYGYYSGNLFFSGDRTPTDTERAIFDLLIKALPESQIQSVCDIVNGNL